MQGQGGTKTLDLAIDPVLAALPFLPAGKGALILILGGLAMLAFSVLLGRFSRGGPYGVGDVGDTFGQRHVRAAAAPRRAHTGPANARRAAASARSRPARRGPTGQRNVRAHGVRARGRTGKVGTGSGTMAFQPQEWDDAPATTTGPATTSTEPASTSTEWVAGLRTAAADLGLGQGRMLQVNGERCVFFLAGCQSCRQRRPGTHGCEATRRAIELVARRQAPRAKAVETACGAITHGACTFEIRRSG